MMRNAIAEKSTMKTAAAAAIKPDDPAISSEERIPSAERKNGET